MTAPALALGRAYVVALILHSAIVVACVGLAVVAVRSLGVGANAARESVGLSAVVFVTQILAAIPSALAVLSWWLCRRRGWQPSTGHMSLTVVVAAALLIFIIVAILS